MNRFVEQDRSRAVGLWLFISAALVFAMVVVGGATRLTGSGLSITEWKPIMGAIPPLNAEQWASAFEKYKAIPQYQLVNAGMSLSEFQGIFWWEWMHRLLGRLVGVVFALPFFVFLALKKLPRRLVLRCVVLLALGGLQGFIGWWMVSSGLSERVDVAPERLTTHLGIAFIIFAGLIWTGLEAWNGVDHTRAPRGWTWGAGLLLALVFIQCLLGGLVAGAKAGFVFTDWPLMDGSVLPPVKWAAGGIAFLHDKALVQFNHRLGAYALLIAATAYAVHAWRWRLAEGSGGSALVLAILVWGQAILGIATLMHGVPLWMGATHQAVAALVLGAATVNLWLVRRSRPRIFNSGPRSTGF